MKSRLLLSTLLVCTIFGSVLTAVVRSQENEIQRRSASESVDLRTELAETLDHALEAAIEDYRDGRASSDALLRINEKLYEAQLANAEPAMRLAVATSYLDRAKDIETLARNAYRKSRGARHQFMEATAAKLRAQLEVDQTEASQ